MGVIAELFVATPDQALTYATRRDDSNEGRALRALLNPIQYRGFTSLELGTLWAILAGVPWDAEQHMPDDTYLGEDGESWLNQLPEALTRLLADASPEQLERACVAWARTDELACEPKHLSPVVVDLQLLAKRARLEGKSVFLWGSL